MNLMTDSERKWALEPESKPESRCFPSISGFDSGSRAHFRSENLMTDSERKWALEAESKPRNWRKTSAS